MPKYDTILNNSDEFTDVKLTPAEGIAAIAIITLLADRPDAELPADELLEVVTSFEIFDEYSDDDLLRMVDKLMEIADEEGLGALFNAADDVDAISDELVPDAYAIALATLIDDQTLTVPVGKQPFLKELREALDVDDEEATEILHDVVATLQGEAHTESTV
jgi:hypothetical protein